MRLLIAMMMTCCCVGYSQDTTAAPEAPVEITTTDDSGDQGAVGTEAKKDEKPAGGGCGCGSKPKF